MRLRHAAGAVLLLISTALPAVDGTASRLNRIALAIGKEVQPVRVDFAKAAIAEVVRVYMEEAQVARREGRTGKRRRELLRWAGAVDAYATELASISETLTPETPVDVSIGVDGSICLNIGGRPVMVGAPRASEQAGFAQRIIERFCAAYRCEDFTPDIENVVVTGARQVQLPVWSFSQTAGPACSTADGLELQFRTLQDLSRKREICTRLVAELNLMLAGLVRQIDTGVRIDWNRVAILGVQNAERQQVVLNGLGNTLTVSVPSLAAVPAFLHRVLPWLAARTKGTAYHLVLLNAEEILTPLLYP